MKTKFTLTFKDSNNWILKKEGVVDEKKEGVVDEKKIKSEDNELKRLFIFAKVFEKSN